MVNSINSDQNSHNKLEINGKQHFLHEKEVANTHASATGTNSLPHVCNYRTGKIKAITTR